ncbi:hypothetical protein [Altererythrobacter sp. Z27]|uniref:hypothetical protein n=1 Tax=Altererythrobacter sp. Z27 TaxID=3461147 RepID=UPI004044FF9E
MYRFTGLLVADLVVWQRNRMYWLHALSGDLESRKNLLALPLAVLALSSVGSGAAYASEKAKPDRDPGCFDEVYENVHPECTLEQRRQQLSRFDLPAIEDFPRKHRSQGDVIVANYWTKNGGGTALAMHRSRKGQAWLELRLVPIGSKRKRVVSRRIKISRATWLDIVAKSHALDFSYRSDSICVGGAAIRIEVISGPGRVRTRVQDTCYLADDVRLFFEDLTDAAFAALPQCSQFDQFKRYRDDTTDTDEALHRCLTPSSYWD